MSNSPKKNKTNLFKHHLSDLKRVCPRAGDVFVCPVCFSVFSMEEALDKEKVNLGHIWPKFIRDNSPSEDVKHQHVLLCKACNSRAGALGDLEMQKFEEYKREKKSENSFLKRKALFISRTENFSMPSDILYRKTGEKSFEVEFDKPADFFRHNQNYKKFSTGQTKCDILIMPQFDIKLALVGWLTSAYLFAFYTFGYRYIFHKNLDKVREIILNSLKDNVVHEFDSTAKSNLSSYSCSQHFYESPTILYITPIQGLDQRHFIEISFLDHHVRLPGRNFYIEQIASDLSKVEDNTRIAIAPNKHIPHDGFCEWDELFADVNYQVVGNAISLVDD